MTWVCKTDWELRKFHGEEYSTHKGTTYNSYLIREKKTVLIDTVWQPFAGEFAENLKRVIPLEKIDAVIANHAEVDHSGALSELMRHIPDRPVYCTANGVKSLKGHHHADWDFHVVKTGDRMPVGDKELVFIEAQMLHWPDSMMTYLTGDNIVFSNDAFGRHYATESLFNDLADQAELSAECLKYYANILTPFSKLVAKKIQEVVSLNVPIDMICPSHGVIWRDNPMQIVEKYSEWAGNYRENQATLVYDSMWHGTRIMAEAISNGIREADPRVTVKLFNISHSGKNDVMAEVFKSKLVAFGSPTVNRGILSAMAGFLEELRGLGFRDKKAAVFGSYGWSGESVSMMKGMLEAAGWPVFPEMLKVLWNPDAEGIRLSQEFGRKIAKDAG